MKIDIKIETGEDVGLDDKIKAGARAVGKKIEDPDNSFLESDNDSDSFTISYGHAFLMYLDWYNIRKLVLLVYLCLRHIEFLSLYNSIKYCLYRSIDLRPKLGTIIIGTNFSNIF
jgi:hypothetical protein